MAFLRKRGDIRHIYWSQDGTKRGRALETKSKAVADEFLKEFEYRLAKKELGQELDSTLDSLKTEYLGYCKATKRTSTYERHEVPRVGRFITCLESKGLRKVSEITGAHVQAYRQHLLDEVGTDCHFDPPLPLRRLRAPDLRCAAGIRAGQRRQERAESEADQEPAPLPLL